MVSSDDVKKVIKLALLDVEESRIETITNQFNSILGTIEELKKYDVSNVEAMSHVHGISNIFRKDEILPGLTTEEALLNAPDKSGPFIRVPLIIDQGENN